MRVIAGKYRHLNLNAPVGKDVTRPTLDRIKEAMFNILNVYVVDAVVLDLFSGSGSLGIEALSRGAKHVYFNDQNNNANKCINDNLKFIKASKDEYTVMKLDYIYINQDGDSEFVLPIQYLNDEQMYILVAYMKRIIELL